jgi:putative phage-type endonuclease
VNGYRLILPASADRADWLTARRGGIGSSDIPAIMGVSAFGSAQHVYYDKRGELPTDDDAGEAALWGSLDEETTAREWARRNRSVVRRIGLIARRDAGHHRCTLDREVRECPLNRDQHEKCALEVKHRNAFVAGKWLRKIPDDVLAQVLWQIHVTGYDHLHVACRIGGIDYRQYVVRRKDHEQLIADLITVADRLWSDVQAGRVPPLTGSEPTGPLLDLYDQLHPGRTGLIHLDTYPAQSAAVTEDLLEYECQRLTEAAAKKAKEAAKARLIERLAGNEAAVLHDEVAYAWPLGDGRATCDLARLAEQWPDAYADCVTQNPGRRFALSKQHRLKEIPA